MACILANSVVLFTVKIWGLEDMKMTTMNSTRVVWFISMLVLACLLCFVPSAPAGSVVSWGNIVLDSAQIGAKDFTAIAVGFNHKLALKSDGSIVAWGLNHLGQAISPEGNDFVAIAAGSFHSLALKSDGSIVGWGANDCGQATPPDGNDFVAIAASGYQFVMSSSLPYSLALKSDGSIVAWGGIVEGYWASIWDYGQVRDTPDDNDFVAIATGGDHCLALKSDGTIVGWGRDYSGQATPPDGNDFVAIAAGSSHCLALKSDGSIVGWG